MVEESGFGWVPSVFFCVLACSFSFCGVFCIRVCRFWICCFILSEFSSFSFGSGWEFGREFGEKVSFEKDNFEA